MPAIIEKWEWICQVPKKPSLKIALPSVTTLEHPLKQSGFSLIARELRNVDKSPLTITPSLINDPLISAFDGIDPLSALAAEYSYDDAETKGKPSKLANKENPWLTKRQVILNKYTTNKKVSMTAGIMSGVEKGSVYTAGVSSVQRDPGKGQPSGIRYRLEQLDDFEEERNKEIAYYSQEEYIVNIRELSSELAQAWHQDLRVKALKITIQCSKLLVDTTVAQFYPSKFVLITDVLDEFGSLVYERLCCKAECDLSNPSLASDSAKETCRNWFYKIASIRELIPRFYLEAAVLKSYNFLSNNEYVSALKRLTGMIKGIGDPLVAVYARCYLCRIGLLAPVVDRDIIKKSFYDFLSTYFQIFSKHVTSELNKQKVDMSTYLNSYIPAVDWIMSSMICNENEDSLNQIVKDCCAKEDRGLLLHSILSTFDKGYIALKATFFIQQISASTNSYFPVHILLKQLGHCLKDRIVLNVSEVVKLATSLISDLRVLPDYLSCASSWATFVVANSSVEQINDFLEDIIVHLGSGDKKPHYNTLHDIMMAVVYNVHQVETIFLMDKFLPLLDTFGNNEVKALTARKILELFSTNCKHVNTTDPVTTDALIFIAKVLHDSVNMMTVDDEKRQVGALISQIIRQIDFGLDMEKQLAFYVEARATFTNLDSVIITLIHCVNKLAMFTGKKVRSHHTRKTAAFVHSCIAYAFVTVPSIRSEVTKLQLYLLTAQVALFNQCLGQVDACIKVALTLMVDIPQNVEAEGKSTSHQSFIMEYVQNMLSTLIIVPDCPVQGVLFLTRCLVNCLQQFSSKENFIVIATLFLRVIDMLSISAQPEYPYHVKQVDSNDVLYGNDQKFINEINKMCTVMLEQVLNALNRCKERKMMAEQSKLAFELFLVITQHADLEAEGMTTLVRKLWAIAKTTEPPKIMEETIAHMKNRAHLCPTDSAFRQLSEQL